MTNLIVAAALILESGGEGIRGMRAVHEVIANRAAARHLTEEKVVLQPKQFSAFNHITPAEAIRKASQHPRWESALAMSAETPRTDLTHGALNYCTTNITPYWATRNPIAILGRHKFYR